MPDAPETPETEVAAKRVGQLARTENIVKIVGIIATLVLVVVLLIQNVTLLAHQDDLVQSSRRADCKTEYSGILNGPVNARNNLAAKVAALNGDLSSQFGAALLASQAGHRPTQADVDAFAATKVVLDTTRVQLYEAIAMVNSLPTLDEASTRGFSFAGRKYLPCPKVG